MATKAMVSIERNSLRLSRPFSIYLKQFDLPIEMAVVRLDGLYGDFVVITQLLAAGMPFLTRGNGYELLNYPSIVQTLAYPPAAHVTSKTGCTFEVFEGGWIPVTPEGAMVRVIVTRYPAPASKPSVYPPVGRSQRLLSRIYTPCWYS